MFITTTGKGASTRVYLVESYREDGKVKKRVIKNFGHLSDLTKDDPNALEKLKAQFDKRAENSAKKAQEAAAAVKSIFEVSENREFHRSKSPEISYANYILRPIWNELGVSKFLCNLQAYNYKNIKYNINDAISTLCFLKIFDPSSIKRGYRHKADLLGAPLQGVSLDNLYFCLDILHNNKDKILRNINNSINKKFKRKYSMIFYDVTNTYIESFLSDEEKNYMREYDEDEFTSLLYSYVESGVLKEEDIKKIFDGDINSIDSLNEDSKKDIKSMLYLRMRGLSKEHRYDLPIISIALIIDENAIPIDYEIFSGNSSEYKTMVHSIDKLKDKYGINDAIVVADRGINSASNMKMLLDHKYGFLVAQKVSNLPEKEKKAMFDKEGYTTYRILKDNEKSECIENIADEISFKVIEYTKSDRNKNNIKCKLIITHSKKREERDLKIANIAIEKAKIAIRNNYEIPNSKQSWINFIEKDKKSTAKKLNEKNINEKKKIAGYAGIIYREPDDKTRKLDLSPDHIIRAYHYLVQIEDCFRIMKNNLGMRPMYVQKEEHINGHVLCCVIGLILLRILQKKLEDFKRSMTIEEIIDALKEAKLIAICDREHGNLFLSTSSYKSIYRNREKFSESELRETLEREGYVSDTDYLLKCQGMEALPSICDRSSLQRFLNFRIKPDKPLIDPVVYDLATGRLMPKLVS